MLKRRHLHHHHYHHHHHHHHHQFLNREGRWGTTNDFTTSFLYFPLFSIAHSLKLSSHLFFCLPYLLPSSTAPCKMVVARLMNKRYISIPLQFPSHWLIKRSVFVWSNCLLDLGTDFLVSNMVFAWDVWYLALKLKRVPKQRAECRSFGPVREGIRCSTPP